MLPVHEPPAPELMLHVVADVASHVLPYVSEAVAVNATALPAVNDEAAGVISTVDTADACAAIVNWVVAEVAPVADAVMVGVPAAVSL